jgi:hypothetical protein
VFDVDLAYEGAFRVPNNLKSGGAANAGFEYGGTALAFDAERRSLFLVGHDWDQFVGEISIPVPKRGSVAQLPRAVLVQPLSDVVEGRLPDINPTDPNAKKIGGLLPMGGELLVSAYSYYDGAATQERSHFVRPIDLSRRGAVRGPFRVGAGLAGMISGYFGRIPEPWQETFGGSVLNGNCCLAIVSRTSYGPAVFAIDPRRVGAAKDDAPARPLVYYPSEHPTVGAWDGTNKYFNGTSWVRGVVFPAGTRSVLFFGRHGLGPFCYGSGTDQPALAGKPGPDRDVHYCFDPSDESKGVHGYPYVPYVWAYDASDLAKVAAGRTRPWDVQPYAVWSLSLPRGKDSGAVGGAAYDAQTGRLFVSEMFGDGTMPVIHAFSLR